jgi:acyl dehydratase
MRYFEDFQVGEIIELGRRTVSEAEIIDFARQFDPQPFHLDKEKAHHSSFGRLVASGWHTASIYMRLLVDGLLNEAASQLSPGLEELRWLKPVYPGDTLSGRLTILSARVSGSRPDTGIVRHLGELFNQDQEVVMRLEGATFFGLRPVAGKN